MVETIFLPTDDLSTEHPQASEVLKALNVPAVRAVKRSPRYPAGLCYWNVEDCVMRYGGSRVDGWMLEWIPNVYIQAMHHAVWLKPDGQHFDVTTPQRPRPDDRMATTFAEDCRHLIDLHFPVVISNHFVDLVHDPDVREAHKAYLENQEHLRNFWSMIKASGRYYWSPQGGLKEPPQYDRLHPDILKNNSYKLRKSFSRLHRQNRRIINRYFSNC